MCRMNLPYIENRTHLKRLHKVRKVPANRYRKYKNKITLKIEFALYGLHAEPKIKLNLPYIV